MTKKEILVLLATQGNCNSICCSGKKEYPGRKSYLNKVPCPFFNTNFSGDCEITFSDNMIYSSDVDYDKSFYNEMRKAAEKELEKIKKLEFLENLQ
jgi:hypothetical protein